jgi:hypothetical protein
VTEHQTAGAKLVVPRGAVVTVAAGDVVVKADSLSDSGSPDLLSDSLNHSGYFMPERHRKRANRRPARSIVSIRVADARSPNADENVPVTRRGDGNVVHLQRFTGFYQTDSAHVVRWLVNWLNG